MRRTSAINSACWGIMRSRGPVNRPCGRHAQPRIHSSDFSFGVALLTIDRSTHTVTVETSIMPSTHSSPISISLYLRPRYIHPPIYVYPRARIRAHIYVDDEVVMYVCAFTPSIARLRFSPKIQGIYKTKLASNSAQPCASSYYSHIDWHT